MNSDIQDEINEIALILKVGLEKYIVPLRDSLNDNDYFDLKSAYVDLLSIAMQINQPSYSLRNKETESSFILTRIDVKTLDWIRQGLVVLENESDRKIIDDFKNSIKTTEEHGDIPEEKSGKLVRYIEDSRYFRKKYISQVISTIDFHIENGMDENGIMNDVCFSKIDDNNNELS